MTSRLPVLIPCGEVPIPSNGACCLGSINLAACVVNGEFDFAKLRRLAKIGFQVLDESINAGVYATEEIKRFELRNRPLGLGVMGYATALIGMKMEYGSREALMFLRSVLLEMKMVGRELLGLNNATLLSIAPTGTISMIAGVSYGIEPLFSVAYNKVVDAGTFPVIEPTLAEYEIDDWEPVLATGSVQGTSLPPHVKRLFRTAGEIDPLTHLYVQATAQEVVDNAVSKTINLPNGTTREAIKALFYRAWELGIKGITVYRDGSRQVQVINGYDESCPNGTCSL